MRRQNPSALVTLLFMAMAGCRDKDSAPVPPNGTVAVLNPPVVSGTGSHIGRADACDNYELAIQNDDEATRSLRVQSRP
jgi:hypothetical protein